ncbi:MAG: hypothetical protein ACM30G_05655, partial [Micromonosporaceae bacterium]
ANRYSFADLAYLVGAGAAAREFLPPEAARLQQLCAYGQRLLDLDAEDFENPDAAADGHTDGRMVGLTGGTLVPRHLIERGRQCRMRQSPDEQPRAALTSLRPTFRLLLEVIEARWRRRETAALVAAVHMASEYAALLAWEPLLGHAGDPAELGADPSFTGPQSRWGHFDDHECPHTAPQKSAANRSLHVANEPPSGWRTYLDRQHSVIAQALSVCAVDCRAPCVVVTTRTPQQRHDIAEACRIAQAFGQCALVRLRHAAPVGHGFGVPSPAEVLEAWERSRLGLARRGGLGASVLAMDGFPLTGLPSLLSAIGATPLTPDTLLHDTAAAIVSILEPQEVRA